MFPIRSRAEYAVGSRRDALTRIRVHLSSLGHPLLGDLLYGGGFRTKANKLDEPSQAALRTLGRQALHASLLGFSHPGTGEPLRFKSALPPDLAALETALRGLEMATD